MKRGVVGSMFAYFGVLRLCVVVLFVAGAQSARADPGPLFDGADGVSCASYNAGGRVPWRNRSGDWFDAAGEAQGTQPFSQTVVRETAPGDPVEFDATALAKGWIAKRFPNDGFLIATAPGRAAGVVSLHSRESADVAGRPELELAFEDGSRRSLPPSADAHLDCSTYQGLGREVRMKVGGGNQYRAVLRFELPVAAIGGKLARATLRLHRAGRQYGDVALALYRLAVPEPVAAKPEPGLAASYADDRGIERDDDVVLAAGFDDLLWKRAWSFVSQESAYDVVVADPALMFEPLRGKALKVTVPKGKLLGLNMGFDFQDKVGSEPEEIYLRYYLRLADNWRPMADGGKFPGVSGTYGKAGWGGQRADPLAGWSMRGAFARAAHPANPMHRYTAIGTYAYHADQATDYGDVWFWDPGGRGSLENNRWYCIEQYFRVNAVGKRDGELKVWIDGVPVFQRKDIRVRDIASIRIHRVWMNVYHGGTTPSHQDQSLYIDNVVVARRYVGPMRAADRGSIR